MSRLESRDRYGHASNVQLATAHQLRQSRTLRERLPHGLATPLSQEWLVPVEDSAVGQRSTMQDIEPAIGIGVVATADPGRIGFDDRPPVSRSADVDNHRAGQACTSAWVDTGLLRLLPGHTKHPAPGLPCRPLERDGHVARIVFPN
jgi:hypothetical protein